MGNRIEGAEGMKMRTKKKMKMTERNDSGAVDELRRLSSLRGGLAR